MSKWNLLRAACATLFLIFTPATWAAEVPQETSQPINQLDINQADAATIAAALDGVGMVKAEEIVAYRTMFGNFRSIDELLEVPGIGAVTIEKNRARIVITGNE